MLWSLLKVLVFVAIAAGLTWGAAFLLETPGEVRLAFAGREITLTPLGFVILMLVLLGVLWLLTRLSGLVVATLRFLAGDETAISRFFSRNREQRGYDALSDGLMALAGGEAKLAQAKAARAERLLDRPDLTRLLNAQAAEASGDTARALGYYKEMVGDERTRFVGLQGLMKAKLAAGDTATAMKLAEKAFALKPRHGGVIDTLFRLQSGAADWAGARRTLDAQVRAKGLPRDVGRRRDAVLLLSEARQHQENAELDKARSAALQAVRIAPDFVPAATLAARLEADAGMRKDAANIIRRAWKVAPHPDLAAAYAAIERLETPSARRARFQPLLKLNPTHPESQLLAAELALAAEDFPGARRALGDLPTTRPSLRSLALMAAVEKGSGAADSVVRGWLARALGASRGEAWICGSCKHIHGVWQPVCDNCQGFDTLSWVAPPAGQEDDTPEAAMLPLIVGALTAGSDTPGPQAERAEDSTAAAQ
jgi:HemY protein